MRYTENTKRAKITEEVFIVAFKPNIEGQPGGVVKHFKSKEEALAFIDSKNKEEERLFDERDFKSVKERWERNKEDLTYYCYTFETYLIQEIEEHMLRRRVYYLVETSN